MKKTNLNVAMWALAASAAFLFASCGKDNPSKPHNPTEIDIPVAKPFQLSLEEERGYATTKAFTWEVAADGALDNHEESIKDLYVTRYNTVTLKATEEVNVSSADPAIVSVSRVDPKTYSLEYKGDGQAAITVWNGEGSARCERRFTVFGKESIDVEGLWFTYGGEELIVKHVYSVRPAIYCQFPQDDENENYRKPRPTQNDFLVLPYRASSIWRWDDESMTSGDFITNPRQGTMLVFNGLYPENTSFRTLYSFESEWECYPNMQEVLVREGIMDDEGVIPAGKYHWPNEDRIKKDVSEYAGLKQWIALFNSPLYMACIQVKTDKKTKYLCLLHGKEEWKEDMQ